MKHRYTFTNHFERSGVKERIRMINSTDHDRAWWRYGLLWLLTIAVIMACQNWREEKKPEEVNLVEEVLMGDSPSKLPETNKSRVLFNQFRHKNWFFEQGLYKSKEGNYQSNTSLHGGLTLAMEKNRLSLKGANFKSIDYYINGVQVDSTPFAKVDPNRVVEIFLLSKNSEMAETSYKLLVETSPAASMATDSLRTNFFAFAKAMALTDHPTGNSRSYTMNGLLEATFFKRRDALVERTKNHYLQVYKEFSKDMTVFIDDQEVDAAAVEKIHVRQVKMLYSRERPYYEWAPGTLSPEGNNIEKDRRYVLFIETAPKRERRDSTYYVFSPFYSGDF
ncbi:hypothetical protein [Tellurirhabdus bombi]|uniref:hypothetical protein n=1 Tax=Tellurirhabdus bombi TaxID=2907205 RepID=UPI001F1FF935|nr:hypothetical protein [Tellurirhabdus bombi]